MMLNKNDKVYFEDTKYTVYVNSQGNIKVLRHEDGKKLDYIKDVYSRTGVIGARAKKACKELHIMFHDGISLTQIFPSYYKKEMGSN